MINYYEELKLDPSLNCEQLTSELNQLQRKWIGRTNAPDLNRRQEAEKKVSIIEQAQGILTDQAKRQEYDLELEKSQTRKDNSSQPERKRKIDDREDLDLQDLINQGWSLVNNKEYPDAVRLARRAVDMEPGSPNTWYLLASAYDAWGNADEAIQAYKQAIGKNINEPAYYTSLGDVYLRLEDIRKAEEYALKARRLDPGNIENRILMGKIARVKKDYDQIINIFTGLLKHQPHNESFKSVVAQAYYNRGMSFCAKNRDNLFYCINKEDTKNMMDHMKKAKQYSSNLEYDKKINWGKQSLKKKFYWPRWKWFIIPFFFTGSGGFYAMIAMIYFNFVPQWRFNRSELFREEITIPVQIMDGLKDFLDYLDYGFRFIKDKLGKLELDKNF